MGVTWGEAGDREDVAAGARQGGGTRGAVGLGNGKWVYSRLILKAKRMGSYLDVRESRESRMTPNILKFRRTQCS